MNKAFLFDMDGVVIHSEPVWEEFEQELLPRLYGEEVAAKMGSLVGLGMHGVLDRAASLGAVFDREHAIAEHRELTDKVCNKSPFTSGLEELIASVKARGYRVGLVTQTTESGMRIVLDRLPRDMFEIAISLHSHPEYKPKPAPDGYLAALKAFDADAASSFVLEDSNLGIQAGKAADCFVIGFKGNLMPDYAQEGADAYANTMAQVEEIVSEKSRQA